MVLTNVITRTTRSSEKSQSHLRRQLEWIGPALLIALSLLSFTACTPDSERGADPTAPAGSIPPNHGDQALPDNSPTAFGEYHAIIIGIEHYQNWPNLHLAEDDAQELQRVLTSYYGFKPENMTLLYGESATRSNVLFAIQQKFEHLTSTDNLLVFFAGHGQLDELNSSGYWIPVDGDLIDRSTWIRFSTISEYLKSSRVEANDLAIITDSCYGGALLSSVRRAVSVVPVSTDDYDLYYSTLKDSAPSRSRRVLASGGPDETVSDNSMFARLLTQALENNTYRYIDLDLLFNAQVYPAMAMRSAQEAKLFEYESRVGDKGHFVFVRQDLSPEEIADNPVIAENSDTTRTNADVITDTSPQENIPQAGVATLTVRSNLANDEVILDGVSRGRTKLEVNVIPGEHHLIIRSDGYHPFESRFSIAIDQHKTISAQLEPIVIPDPSIEYFSAEVSTIRPGDSTELAWRTLEAKQVEIKELGNIANTGNMMVSPDQTTSYTLVATNENGVSKEQTIVINVVENAPVINYFEVKPRQIRPGEEILVAWKTSDASKVALQNRAMSLSGEQTIKPNKSMTLKLVATNSAGKTVESTAKINVIEAPKIVKFSAERSTITKGNSTRLYWQTEGADAVVIDGLGKFRPQGHVDVKPDSTTVYELTAYGGRQRQVSQLKVAVSTGWKEVNPVDRIRSDIAVPVQTTATVLTQPASTYVGTIATNPALMVLTSVVASNSLDIKQAWTADLDTGKSGAGTASDIWFNAKTNTRRFLTPKNGALFGPINTGALTAAQCKKQQFQSRSHSIQNLTAGKSVCVKTNKGNTSLLQITKTVGSASRILETKFTTWR